MNEMKRKRSIGTSWIVKKVERLKIGFNERIRMKSKENFFENDCLENKQIESNKRTPNINDNIWVLNSIEFNGNILYIKNKEYSYMGIMVMVCLFPDSSIGSKPCSGFTGFEV